MKNLKVLGLAALIVAALMACAASASATTVTTTTGGPAGTPTIHAVSEGHTSLKNPIATILCDSTLEGKVESHGPEVSAEGNILTFVLTPCTNGWHKTTLTNGNIQVNWTGGHNGTVTSNGVKVEATRFGIRCIYGTVNTVLGTVTGGNPATIHINAKLPIFSEESAASCGIGSYGWTGSYVTTSALYIAP